MSAALLGRTMLRRSVCWQAGLPQVASCCRLSHLLARCVRPLVSAAAIAAIASHLRLTANHAEAAQLPHRSLCCATPFGSARLCSEAAAGQPRSGRSSRRAHDGEAAEAAQAAQTSEARQRARCDGGLAQPLSEGKRKGVGNIGVSAIGSASDAIETDASKRTDLRIERVSRSAVRRTVRFAAS